MMRRGRNPSAVCGCWRRVATSSHCFYGFSCRCRREKHKLCIVILLAVLLYIHLDFQNFWCFHVLEIILVYWFINHSKVEVNIVSHFLLTATCIALMFAQVTSLIWYLCFLIRWVKHCANARWRLLRTWTINTLIGWDSIWAKLTRRAMKLIDRWRSTVFNL